MHETPPYIDQGPTEVVRHATVTNTDLFSLSCEMWKQSYDTDHNYFD